MFLYKIWDFKDALMFRQQPLLNLFVQTAGCDRHSVRLMKGILAITFIFMNIVCAKELVVGRLDDLAITREASELVCLGFEGDHPKNKCKELLLDHQAILNELQENRVHVAILPEEFIIKNRTQNRVNFILPLYQQYFIGVGNDSFSFQDLKSLHGKKFGVASGVTLNYRVTPLLASLGITKKQVEIELVDHSKSLVDRFCHYDLDGVFIMTNSTNAISRELTTACDGKMLSLTKVQIERFIRQNPVFFEGMIPAKMYWRVDEDILTFSSRLFLVSNKNNEVIEMLATSMEHIMEEIMISNLRQLLTSKTILESYRAKEIVLHPIGEAFINALIDKVEPKVESTMDGTIMADPETLPPRTTPPL